ncbi:carbonic anhydrase family protein [Lacticaseibacillus absianus]|uniref:carbonic anhydrase family protein n=1 Tax=Lacticaseibacillus absianus TaxID=2729623 RepID=UPI0015CEAAF3|nr:carbonic anhydrase family protein [Lacticaseibacillus absianus]
MRPFDYSDQASWQALSGQAQSPITLAGTPDGQCAVTLTAPYQTTALLDVGTTVRQPGSGGLILDGRAFSFVQAHWHAPVEHRGAGDFAVELHLVHRSELGQPLVVALLLPLGAADPVLAAVQGAFRRGQATAATLDLTPLWPTDGTAFRYAGSLTTPPLTEGVEWCVIAQRQRTVSPAQVAWFIDRFGATARDPQPLNGRPVRCQAFRGPEAGGWA